MKYKFFFIEIILLCALLVCNCTGCGTRVYAAQVVDDLSFETAVNNRKPDSSEKMITIGQSMYNAKMTASVKSELTNETYDVYETVNSSDELLRGKIKRDSKTGEIKSFYGINPYPKINDIEKLSDDELKSTVEQLIGESVDFTEYNVFSVLRPNSSSFTYDLVWQVERDLLCNIKLEIVITEDGVIEGFFKTDACPDDLSQPFVTTRERNGLLESSICDYLGIDSIDKIEYEIESETLSYYQGKSSIIYVVRTVEDGFVQLIVLAIS